jgi:DNA ligase (NAD+)
MIQKTRELQKKETLDFILEEVLELQKVLEYHSDLYYNKEKPIISDKEYDDLLNKLEELEKNF